MRRVTHEVITDGRTTWVNGPEGMCLGRFGRNGIDVHHGTPELQGKHGSCLYCKPGPMGRSDWDHFVAAIKKHFDIDVEENYMPTWLRTS